MAVDGTNRTYLKELMAYWLHQYDWRKHEQEMDRFAHYRTTIENIPIHFIHEPRAWLEGLAGRLGLNQRIHFLGWCTDVETILKELDVVICASKNEGTPVALIEAMAAGVPVLSTDVGGVADLVAHGETGWLVRPGDPPSLARGIQHLLGDAGLRARLAAAGRDVAIRDYDVTRLIPRVEGLYSALINEKLTRHNGHTAK